MENKQNSIEYKDESKTYGISIGMLVGMGIGATIKKNCNK